MKVLIADNHTLFREGFSSQLQRFDVLNELQEIKDFAAMKILAGDKKEFDVVFVDRDILGTEWKDGFKAVKEMFPQARVVMLSESEDQRDILDAFDMQAAGYITKTSGDSLIINALRLIMDGNTYVPRHAPPRAGRKPHFVPHAARRQKSDFPPKRSASAFKQRIVQQTNRL